MQRNRSMSLCLLGNVLALMAALPSPATADSCGNPYSCPATTQVPAWATRCPNATTASPSIATYAFSTQGPEYNNPCCIGGVGKKCHDYDVTCAYNYSWDCKNSAGTTVLSASAGGATWTGSPTGTTSTGCVVDTSVICGG